MSETVYQQHAYRSDQVPAQPARPEKTLAQRLLSAGQRMLPWTRPTQTVSTRTAQVSPSQWQKMKETAPNKECFWNEHTLEGITGNIWVRVYLVFSGLAKVTILYLTPIAIFSVFLTSFIAGGVDGMIRFLTGYFLYVIIPCSIIWGQFELYNRGYWKPKLLSKLLDARKIFELNRRTGMVTLYKRGGRVRYSYPFIEFDCILATTPSQQGLVNYSLLLAHRYSGSMHGVPIGTLVTPHETVAEYYRLWNMIQQYMDVTHPLPDILLLEEARPKDPTTAAYDQQTGRNPRYWRDMSDDAYAEAITQIEAKQSQMPETGPELDIFAKA
ncbi:hypothetical protein [Vibrio gazogenes]|uniref:Uncharacterized protein n=1 Tax=Vibrio gazogenes TaxID=687 RepID=A0A1Z2SEK8_VIBGA|nr:hypothetical protein [Vibrio gazogenes]ASA55620.1 hypothetical protein BSQ33_07865 [Vibrio gazogenes]ASA55629.1 hypothetical protein BSQ33_07915 [Vibrio gazogenes]